MIKLEVLQYVENMTTDELAEVVHFDMPQRGGAHRNSRWKILLHMVNHGADHRAQIMARLHELGAHTFEHDLILHLWSSEEG